MTREEAIKILGPETRRETMKQIPVFERIAADQEACRLAVAALRAQQGPARPDWSRWEGCYWCIGHCPNVTGDPHCDYRFCPICGRPLTEEALAELERRIGGSYEKSDRN